MTANLGKSRPRISRPTIKIFADDNDHGEVREALPGLFHRGPIPHEVSMDLVTQNLADLMHKVEAMFASATTKLNSLEVKEVTVAVSVDSSGQFSLLGTVKAGIDVRATFQITFVPKTPLGK